MENNIRDAFIRQEKRVLESMIRRIAEIKERAEQDIANCEKRIKEAEENIASV